MSKKKTHQDQLWLNFDQAVTDFQTAAATLSAAAQAVKEQQPAAIELQAQRKKLNKLVRVHARHKNLHWREIWRVLYERLRDKTGFDAIAKGIAKDISPLEAVIKGGKLPRLLKLAENA